MYQETSNNFYGNQNHYQQHHPPQTFHPQAETFQNHHANNQQDMGQSTDPNSYGSESKVEYVDYNCLVNFPPGTDMMALFEHIKANFESMDWSCQFSSMNALRTLNKFYPAEINAILNQFGSYVQTALNSHKPFIAKNVLLFVIEFLQNAKTSGLSPQVVVALIPILVGKTATGHKSLQQLAEKALQTIVLNCLCDEVIQAFCVNSATKNKTANKRSFFYLTISVDAIKENISQLNAETLKTLFQCLAHALVSDCADNKTYAKQILNFIKNLMTADNYMNYAAQLYNGGLLTAPQAEALIKAVETKNETRKSLADALREAKMADPSFQASKGHSQMHPSYSM